MFASIWSGLTGQKVTLGMGQKIYKIEKVLFPKAQGEFRLDQTGEVDIIAQWLVEFVHESLPPLERKSFEERRPQAARAIEKQLAYVWVNDGQPVAMTNVSRPTRNGISVNAVYTPPRNRKKGYASALVAHVSQQKLDERKKFCVLYTDLGNPISNRIYQAIGYREVSDSLYFLFD